MSTTKLSLGLAAAVAALVLALAAPASPAAAAQRIVSLSPTATEMLFAIGAGKQVVAVDDQSNYPASAPRTKLSGLKSSPEAIAKYEPDLVVVQYDPGGLARGLKALGIPLLVQPAAASLADSYRQINELGAVTGHRSAASSLVARMRSQIAAAVAKAKARSWSPKVYYELDDHYYSVTSKTFVGQILKVLRLRNIADAADKTGSGYPQLSAEYVLAANPEVILLADTKCCRQSAATVAKRPGWKTIAAVRNGAVVGLDDDIASRWGPRTVELVRTIAAKVAALAP